MMHSDPIQSDHVCEEDPLWGSAMMRERYKTLRSINGQDGDSVASTDLGLIWA